MSLAIHNCSGHVRRWHAHVSNAEAARQEVIGVDGCPQRDADTQHLARCRAAHGCPGVRVRARRVGRVARRDLAEELRTTKKAEKPRL